MCTVCVQLREARRSIYTVFKMSVLDLVHVIVTKVKSVGQHYKFKVQVY